MCKKKYALLDLWRKYMYTLLDLSGIHIIGPLKDIHYWTCKGYILVDLLNMDITGSVKKAKLMDK